MTIQLPKATRPRAGEGSRSMHEVQPVRAPAVLSRAAFYAELQLPDEKRIALQAASERIWQRLKRVAGDVVEIGRELLTIRECLPDGQFGAWREAEYGDELSERMAQHFMNVARTFGDRPEMLSGLSVTAAYLLAAPSTPAVIADAVFAGQLPATVTAIEAAIKHGLPAPAHAAAAPVAQGRPRPPRSERLVDLVYAAEGEQAWKHAGRVAAVRRAINLYNDDAVPAVTKALSAWAKALAEAATE